MDSSIQESFTLPIFQWFTFNSTASSYTSCPRRPAPCKYNKQAFHNIRKNINSLVHKTIFSCNRESMLLKTHRRNVGLMLKHIFKLNHILVSVGFFSKISIVQWFNPLKSNYIKQTQIKTGGIRFYINRLSYIQFISLIQQLTHSIYHLFLNRLIKLNIKPTLNIKIKNIH